MMIWRKKRSRRGTIAIEYAALVTMLLFAFWIGLRGYIQRGMQGRWKAAGDTFGQGKQYEPLGTNAVGRTSECFYSDLINPSTGARVREWVDLACFETNCDCSLESDAGTYSTVCIQCLRNCDCTF